MENNNNTYYVNEREELLPFVPKGLQRTLEVGCSSGFFSAQVKRNMNVEAWGIEMVEEPASVAKGLLDKVFVGTFEDVADDLPKEYFDCVFFNDVIEHMVNPEWCLKKVKENLRPGKYVFASIPNVFHESVVRDLLVEKDWRYQEFGILDKTHLRFFTRKSIIRMFEECGYTIDLIKGINASKLQGMAYWINKLLFNKMKDMKYTQFVVVARVAN